MELLKINTRIFILFMASFLLSCTDEEEGDTTPPDILTIISVEPTNGGGIITYELPSDNDVLFVRADYINGKGEEVFRVASKHVNQIEVSGLISSEEITVRLTVVDESENYSETVEALLTPEPSFIFLVQNSIELIPDLGGVRVSWENIEEKTVFVYLHMIDNGEEEVRILSSNKRNYSIFVRGLQAVPISFSTKVEDFDGNITPLEDKGVLTPLFEEKIEKDTWQLVSNLSIDGNAWEGRTVNFWDDVIDTNGNDSDNSYFIIYRSRNGGSLKWPLDIVIDLNKSVKINRFKVWQRAYWYNGPAGQPYYYQAENLKSFDVFVSTDKMEWTLLGQFDIGDAANSSGIISEEKLDEAAAGHDFSLEAVSQEFRYLKFSITSNYGSDTYVHGSEISLYGLDNL